MKRIIAQVQKELTQFSRDRMTVVLALILPLVLLWLLGSCISLTVTDLPVVVQDWDQTPTSRRYTDGIRASLTFRLIHLPVNESAESVLDNGKARAAIVIPENFESDMKRGKATEVQWLIDGTDANTANVMRGNASALTQAFNQENGPAAAPAISAQTRFWFNLDTTLISTLDQRSLPFVWRCFRHCS